MYDIRRDLYHHIQRLSLSYHDRHKSGDLVSRLTSDVDAVQDFVSTALLDVVVNVLTLGGMLVVMLYLNWRFTLIGMIVAPLLFVEVYTLTRRIKQGTRAIRKKEAEVLSVVQESLSSIRLVKAFAREDYEENRLKQETLEAIDVTLRAKDQGAAVTGGRYDRRRRNVRRPILWRDTGAGGPAHAGFADRVLVLSR